MKYLLSALLFCAVTLPGFAAGPVSQDVYFPEFRPDADMESTAPEKNFLNRGIQYGGWLMPVIIDQRDSDVSLTSSLTTVKLWLKSYLWSNSFIYARVKGSYFAVIHDSEDAASSDDVYDVDVAFISMRSSGGSIAFSAGRKFFNIGTGLILNGRGDGAEIELFSKFVDLKILGMYTGLLNKDSNPYGLSDKDISSGAKRIFAGGTISRDIYNHTLYAFGLAQIDQGRESSGTNTRYQSQYYGGGIRGVILDSLYYFGEFIYETGKSYISGKTTTADISAVGVNTGVNYYLNAASKPALLVQYSYGSGDSDRAGYKNPSGNQKGSDTGFISFGTYVGGYGLKPVLANIHVIRGGFSILPFYFTNTLSLNRLTLAPKYSAYLKDKTVSPIESGGGTGAVNSKKFIGQGGDLFLKWKIFSDLSFFANYGFFVPGQAYPSSTPVTHFTMAGLNLSF